MREAIISSKSNNLLENSCYWIKSIRNVHFERLPVGQLQNNKALNSLLLTSTAVKVKSLQSCLTLYNPMDCSPPGSCLWDFPGKNTRMDCHFLLQGIFLTQGSNPCLLYWLACSLSLTQQVREHNPTILFFLIFALAIQEVLCFPTNLDLIISTLIPSWSEDKF